MVVFGEMGWYEIKRDGENGEGMSDEEHEYMLAV